MEKIENIKVQQGFLQVVLNYWRTMGENNLSMNHLIFPRDPERTKTFSEETLCLYVSKGSIVLCLNTDQTVGAVRQCQHKASAQMAEQEVTVRC